jgi:hypothetical protein
MNSRTSKFCKYRKIASLPYFFPKENRFQKKTGLVLKLPLKNKLGVSQSSSSNCCTADDRQRIAVLVAAAVVVVAVVVQLNVLEMTESHIP